MGGGRRAEYTLFGLWKMVFDKGRVCTKEEPGAWNRLEHGWGTPVLRNGRYRTGRGDSLAQTGSSGIHGFFSPSLFRRFFVRDRIGRKVRLAYGDIAQGSPDIVFLAQRGG